MKGNKGQISSLQGIIVTLIIIAILLGAGFFILEEFRDQDEFTDTAASVSGEKVTVIEYNVSGHLLEGASRPGANSFVISSIINTTAGNTIGAGNYSVSDSGLLTNITAAASCDWNVTYTYKYGDTSYVGINDTLGSMTTIPELLPLIILIMIIGIVLAIVLGIVPGAGRMQGA